MSLEKMDFDEEDLTNYDDQLRPKTSGKERESSGLSRPTTRFEELEVILMHKI